jgi:hypothetical protein
MNYDFSIEASSEKIQNPNTKEYFKEVYQTYVNGNYRSAMVMLYSVLICDLVYKLRDLRDIYSDKTAKSILDTIEGLQLANPKSPEWESKLIDEIQRRTSLLEPSDILSIDTLQKARNLSAHPVLTNSDLLYSPNKETARASIRNILEGILINPPFFSNKIFDSLLLDIALVKDKFSDFISFRKYLDSRYLNKLKENDLKKIFKSLWRVTFITDDTKSNENHFINRVALRALLSKHKDTFVNLIRQEKDYFGNITRDDRIYPLITLIARFPEIYDLLPASLQLLIKIKIKSDDNSRLVAWFIYPSIEEHIKALNPEDFSAISARALNLLESLANENGCMVLVIKFLIDFFGRSKTYDETLLLYEQVIEPIKDILSLEQVKQLIEVSDANSQIYFRIGMKAKMEEIVSKFGSEINKADYGNIFRV